MEYGQPIVIDIGVPKTTFEAEVAARLSDKAESALQLENLLSKWQNLSGDFVTIDQARFNPAGITGFAFSSGIATGTPNVNYGALWVWLRNIIKPGNKYLITGNVKASSTINMKITSYFYNGATALGNQAGGDISVGTSWKRISLVVTPVAGANSITCGPALTGVGVAPFPLISLKDFMIIDVTNFTLDNPTVEAFGGFWAYLPSSPAKTAWYGKYVLAIGDSLSAALQWQTAVTTFHGCNITTHAEGGIGLVTMVDGDGGLPALTSADVTGKDLIVLFGGMNERYTGIGAKGDLYPTQDTLYGRLQYVINKLYTLLQTANNLMCKILIITPHCCGKSAYIDADGYSALSGHTLEDVCNALKICAQYNNLRVVDLWHDSGIGKNTWNVYTASPSPIADPPIDGAPYPNNADQVHLNNTVGYPLIGRIIAEEMNRM